MHAFMLDNILGHKLDPHHKEIGGKIFPNFDLESMFLTFMHKN
jgi:hypothetical protein